MNDFTPWPGLNQLREQSRQILKLASRRLTQRSLPLPEVSIGEPHSQEADGPLYVLVASTAEPPYAVTLSSLIAQVQALLCSEIDWGLVAAADHPQLLRALADLEHLQPLIDQHKMAPEA